MGLGIRCPIVSVGGWVYQFLFLLGDLIVHPGLYFYTPSTLGILQGVIGKQG